MKDVAESLRKAREKISNPENWTTGAFARMNSGKSVSEISPWAVCWCSMGAIDSLYPNGGGGRALNFLLASIREKHGFKSIAEFNDTNTHSEVIAAFDRAIELAEAAQ